MAGMGDLLKAAAGGGGAAPAPNLHGVGLGAPPGMPEPLPPATGMGALPTGAATDSKKDSASNAISALRTAMGNFPALAPQMTAIIESLKMAAKGEPTTPVGAPAPPGAPPATPDPVGLSGSPGPV